VYNITTTDDIARTVILYRYSINSIIRWDGFYGPRCTHTRHTTHGLVDIVKMVKHLIKFSLSLILVFWHPTSQRNLDRIKV